LSVPISWRLALAAVVGCAALAIAAALASHGGAAHADAPLTAQGQFAVLSKSSPAPDVDLFGSKVGRVLAQQAAQSQDIATSQKPYTPDAAAARTRVDSSGATPRAISVAPASNGGVCLATREVTGPMRVVCGNVGEIARGALVSSGRPAPAAGVDPDDWDIVALLPDGVRSVTFTAPDGQSAKVAVVDNTATRTVRHLTTMSFDSPLGGPQTQSVTPEDAR
jgi:hypothetical protein